MQCKDQWCSPVTKCSISCRSAAVAAVCVPHRGCSRCSPCSAHRTWAQDNGASGICCGLDCLTARSHAQRCRRAAFESPAHAPFPIVTQRQAPTPKPCAVISSLHSDCRRRACLQQRREDAAVVPQHLLRQQHRRRASQPVLQSQTRHQGGRAAVEAWLRGRAAAATAAAARCSGVPVRCGWVGGSTCLALVQRQMGCWSGNGDKNLHSDAIFKFPTDLQHSRRYTQEQPSTPVMRSAGGSE